MQEKALIEFGCKEPGCSEKAVYTRAEVSGALLKKSPLFQVERTVPIYLTCGAGHVHRYSIEIKPTGGESGD